MASPKFEFSPPVIAQRGASFRAPENTLAAFKAAYEDGVGWLKADVKLTADGAPILISDDSLDRTTSGRGAVADMTLAEMQNLDAGSWFSPKFAGERIPLLSELLVFAREAGMRLNLELKPCAGRTQATAMVALIEIAKLWPERAPPPLISSLDIEALVIAAQMHPGLRRCLILDEWRADWRELASLGEVTSLNLNANILTSERLALLRGTTMPLLAYTVNEPQQAKELLDQGVQAVFSENPAKILGAL